MKIIVRNTGSTRNQDQRFSRAFAFIPESRTVDGYIVALGMNRGMAGSGRLRSSACRRTRQNQQGNQKRRQNKKTLHQAPPKKSLLSQATNRRSRQVRTFYSVV